jgi:hypothetical protein
MSLSIRVLDFWTMVSDYLQRSTLSSLRVRSDSGLISRRTERSRFKKSYVGA